MKRLLWCLLLAGCVKRDLPAVLDTPLVAPVPSSISLSVTKTTQVLIPGYSSTSTPCNMVTYTPPGATGRLPVVVFVPGNGEVGTNPDELYTNGPLHFIKAGWRPNFIVVGIQPLFGCNSASPKFAHYMLTEIRKNPLVDTTRLYFTGLSGGAFTVLHYIRDWTNPYPIRAIMVFSMGMSAKCADAPCAGDLRFKTIPSWGMAGTSDSQFEPGMKKYFTFLTGAGYNAKYNEFSGGHCCWNSFYDPNWSYGGYSVYNWLLKWGGGKKYIRVNVTDSAHLYTGWNNLVHAAIPLKYTTGTASQVTASLSRGTFIDNGATYGTGMAPAGVLRYGSYSTGSRTLTLDGLEDTKTYNLELYASRNRNAAEKTVFTLGAGKSVATYDNFSSKVTFTGLVPISGRITVQITSAATYNYLNGFTLTEITN